MLWSRHVFTCCRFTLTSHWIVREATTSDHSAANGKSHRIQRDVLRRQRSIPPLPTQEILPSPSCVASTSQNAVRYWLLFWSQWTNTSVTQQSSSLHNELPVKTCKQAYIKTTSAHNNEQKMFCSDCNEFVALNYGFGLLHIMCFVAFFYTSQMHCNRYISVTA